MSASFISAKIIEIVPNVIKNDAGVIGVNVNTQLGAMGAIPTPGAGGYPDGDFWAVPVGLDFFSGFNYKLTTPTSTAAPTPDSFHVVRIRSLKENTYWYIRGVSWSNTAGNYGYVQASQDAENGLVSGARTMPTDLPVIGGTQYACVPNSAGAYFVNTGLPSISGTDRFYPSGWYKEAGKAPVAFAAATANGYTSVANLLNFLNASWNTYGTSSPAKTIVWTASADNLTLTGTLGGADGTDQFSIVVKRWVPSV